MNRRKSAKNKDVESSGHGDNMLRFLENVPIILNIFFKKSYKWQKIQWKYPSAREIRSERCKKIFTHLLQ
jgi:hypothetical protein